MIDGPLGGAAFNNEFGRPNLGGYFRVYEQTRRRGAAARLPQADHDRRRPRRDRGVADAQDRLPGRHAAGPARRPGHAHRHGRRRGQLDGRRRQRRRARLRLGAARQPRDPAARAGGHQPLLARSARRTRSWRSTTSAPAASRNAFPELVDGAGRGAPLRPAQGAGRGERPGAEGDLVQREPGALRDGDRAGVAAAVRRDVRARALPVRGRRRRDRRRAQLVVGAIDGAGAATRGRSTCRWTCCSASRRRCSATCSARRARCRALDLTGVDARRTSAFDVLRHPRSRASAS